MTPETKLPKILAIAVAKAIRTNVPKPIVNPSFRDVLTVVAVAIPPYF